MDLASRYKINVLTLGNGIDGEMLAYNFANNLLYHGSGNFFLAGFPDNVLETIDPLNLGAPPVDNPLAGSLLNGNETNAITYDSASGGFWWASGYGSSYGCATGWCSDLYSATTSGVGTYIGLMDHLSKGLATLP